MSRWQRLLRYGLAIFAVVFAGIVYFAIRERQPSTPSATSERTDPEAIAESVGGASQLAKETLRTFGVEYGRLLTYADGRSRFLDGLHVTVPPRNGRGFELTAKQGETKQDQSSVWVEGDVQLTSTDGLVVNAPRATYESADEIVRVPDRVHFTRQRMFGSSNGATYDRGRDVLWLLQNADITIKPDKRGLGDAHLTAGTAGFARRDRYLRFEQNLKLLREGQVVEADGAMVYLHATEDTINMIELRGNSRVTRTVTKPGDVQAMTARDINLHYSEDGSVLERATLVGDAVMQFAGESGQPGRRLTAIWIEVLLSAEGPPQSLSARDNVELQLPGNDTTPNRRIRALSLEATGPPGQGITSARFLDNVQFREARAATPTQAAVDREVRSRSLDTVVRPGFGSLEAAVFGGGMRFEDESGRVATAPDGTYNVVKSSMQLVAAQGGQGAQVNDARAAIEGRTVDIALDGKGLVADGDVRSVLKASSAKDTSVKRPGMLKNDQPVNVTSAHLDYDSANSKATYTGDARLWQGETAIQAPTLMIDDKLGNLNANGGVKSTLRLEDTDPKTKKSEKRTTVATSQDLVYEDQLRRATYSTDARMNGPNGDLTAKRIELYLDASGDKLDRVEAYESVTLVSENRTSAGARLSYFAADERYVMGGSPVRVLEQLPQECRETLGKTLTFFRATDSITVDGNDERRTQTTSGGKCPEPRGQ